MKIFIVTVWFWEGDSNIIQEYGDCFNDYGEVLRLIDGIKKEFPINRIIEHTENFDPYKERGCYGSPAIIQIILKEFS